MYASQSRTPGSSGKKRRGASSSSSSSSGPRGRKKHKRLDCIRDRPIPPTSPPRNSLVPADDDDPSAPRRSCRARRAPVVLDSSPVPSNRKRSGVGRNPTPGVSRESRTIKKKRRKVGKEKNDRLSSARKAITFLDQGDETPAGDGVSVEEEGGEWGLRLRPRGGKRSDRVHFGIAKSISPRKPDFDLMKDHFTIGKSNTTRKPDVDPIAEDKPSLPLQEEAESPSKPSEPSQEEVGSPAKASLEGKVALETRVSEPKEKKKKKMKKKKKKKKRQKQKARDDTKDGSQAPMIVENDHEDDSLKTEKEEACEETSLFGDLAVSCLNDKECSAEKTPNDDKSKAAFDSQNAQDCNLHMDLGGTENISEQEARELIVGTGSKPTHSDGGETASSSEKSDNDGFHNGTDILALQNTKNLENDANSRDASPSKKNKDVNFQAASPSDVQERGSTGEGRRCGLCGRGHDGKPPKRLVHELVDSDNEVYNGASAAEEPNYDVWDGFGNEPEWLGHLLGPIRDRFGIARVWVHQNCAVWSPEVYFAGLGCLKNVRAALCRGRVLKCCRCGRPGATIGCRVDRCPKTYHLPCARADGCIFDHRKFLIACTDHRHLFQPRGHLYVHHLNKLKAKKMKLEIRKLSNEASRKDLEAEEKWLENCGEDEEFLKRESKRLQRDILRIAPVYIGGSLAENQKLFQGWESVAGLQDVIRCMKEVVILPLLYPEFFSSLGLTPPRGVLLHGYPGTGKTLVVRALIGECSRGNKRIAYFARKGADCLGKYVGDAERQLRLLFQVAEKSQPSIIFFDEIDGLAPCRSKRQDQTHSSVVSTLLSLLDGLKSRGSVIVIGATNRPEAIDPALRRPGRFDREIYFPLPSVKDRSAILSLHTRSWPRPLSEPVLTWIANQTAGYAGADLQALCTQAAMISLKRNCPLQEIMSSAEKGSCSAKLPRLPPFAVEETDWLAALAYAPPPCSRREAGIAANDVVSTPLQSHLFPCLIQPLAQLLISFNLEERIWLPPALRKASKSIESIIFSILDDKKTPNLCVSHLPNLIQDPHVAKQVERSLFHYGLLVGKPILCTVEGSDSDGIDELETDSSKPNTSASGCGTFVHNMSLKSENSLGYRVLISGTPRSGQHFLASCLIHGFMGHIDIQKINLATISQEGHGDIIRGLSQILLKCLSLRRCVLYMPRIDLWALDQPCELNTYEKYPVSNVLQSSKNGEVHHATKRTSQAWDSFVEQVDSMCAYKSIIILATSEMRVCDLPLEARQFFANDVRKSKESALEHSIPRFSVELDGKFDHELLIDSAAAKVTQDLAQQYIQKVHHKVHSSNMHGNNNFSYMNDDYRVEGQDVEPECTEAMAMPIDSDRVNFNSRTSIRNNLPQIHASTDQRQKSLPSGGQDENCVLNHCNKSSDMKFPPNKAIKGNLALAMSSFGYQILRFPHFAELCWATSRLREGPSADISGSLKAWPFNSCIIRPCNSNDRIARGQTYKSWNDGKNSGLVRGLTAVGLLAYRGAYASIREVSFEVRKVLELLVGEINAKILAGKDQHRYLRLLSQVAYLEDMVNSWAYSLQSLQIDSSVMGTYTGQVLDMKVNLENQTGEGEKLPCDTILPDNFNKSIGAEESEQRKCEQNLGPSNGDCINQSSILASEVDNQQDNVSSAPITSCLDSINHVSESAPDGPREMEETVECPSGRREEPLAMYSVLLATETWHPSEDKNNLHNPDKTVSAPDLRADEGHESFSSPDTSVPSVKVNGHRQSDKLGTETDYSLKTNGDALADSEVSCMYECCVECLHKIHVLTQKKLTCSWESRRCHLTVDDINGVVASCSASLLAATARFYSSESVSSKEDCCAKGHDKHTECSCCQVVDNILIWSMPPRTKALRSIVSPAECSCHARNEDTAMVDSSRSSPFNSGLTFFFRNNTMVPFNPSQDTVFHCNLHKLCLCPIINMISTTKESLDLRHLSG